MGIPGSWARLESIFLLSFSPIPGRRQWQPICTFAKKIVWVFYCLINTSSEIASKSLLQSSHTQHKVRKQVNKTNFAIRLDFLEIIT